MALTLIYNPEGVDLSKITYEEVSEMFKNYVNLFELPPEAVALFLYASSVSYEAMLKLLRLEEKRIRNYVRKVGKSKSYIIGKKIVSDYVGIKFKEESAINRYYAIFDIEFVALVANEKVIKNILEKQGFSGTIRVGRIVVMDTYFLDFALEIYKSYLQTLVLTNRAEFIQMFKNEVFDKFVEDELKTYSYKITSFPPCIETIIRDGVSEGMRNNSLFALVSFFKMIRTYYGYDISDSKIEEIVWKTNQKFDPPLSNADVTRLLTYHLYGSGQHKIYNYCGVIRRNMPSLCPMNPKECFRRHFKKITKKKSKPQGKQEQTSSKDHSTE